MCLGPMAGKQNKKQTLCQEMFVAYILKKFIFLTLWKFRSVLQSFAHAE
jgi:hypothetical protein